MKKILCLLLLLAAPARAQEGLCPPPRGVPLDVRLDYAPPVINDNLSGTEMNGLLDKDSAAKGHAIGLTLNRKSETVFSVAFAPRVDRGKKSVCVDPAQITYVIKYRPQIYVPFDLPVMGCEHGAVVRHEARHVNAFLASANAYMPRFRAALAGWLARQTPTMPLPATQADVEARKKEIGDALMQALAPERAAFYAAEAQAQLWVDSMENPDRKEELIKCPARPAASMLGIN